MILRLGGFGFWSRKVSNLPFYTPKGGTIKTVTFCVFEIRGNVFDYRRGSYNVIYRDDWYLHIRTTIIKVLLPEICFTLLLLL